MWDLPAVEVDACVSQFRQLAIHPLNELERLCVCKEKRIAEEQEEISSYKNKTNLLHHKKEEIENILLDIEHKRDKLIYNIKSLRGEEEELQKSIALHKVQLSELSVEYCILQQEREEKKQLALKKFQTLNCANAYFKEYLKIYIELENSSSSTFSVIFFYENTGNQSPNNLYYVKLELKGNNEWNVLEMNPSLSCKEEITEHLKRSGDIQGFLAHLHDRFFELKSIEE